MKILILSASTGGGHMKAAGAMEDYFKKNGAETIVVDTLKYISPLLNKTVTESYEYLIKRIPNVYKIIYQSSNNKVVNRLIFGISGIVGRRLVPLIYEYNPDIIVTTHPFPNEMVSKLKDIGKAKAPIVCVMTDYAPHRTWIVKNVDAYIVSNEHMMNVMVKEMQVDRNIIYPFGIPIEGDFYTKIDRKTILEQMGMDANIPTVLIMAGSFGVGNIISIYKSLLKIDFDFQIIIITGKNPKLYKAIKSIIYGKEGGINRYNKLFSKFSSDIKSWKYINKFDRPRGELNLFQKKPESPGPESRRKSTRLIYFTDEVYKYMNIADLIITKPGGLTITEALACNLPMAIFNAIPGQEEENADFLVSNNMAVKLDQGSVENTIKGLLENKKKLDFMKCSCENFDKSESLKNTLNLLKSLA